MTKKKLNNEDGRSMVEMLGVLAVMGVLSVAGIAGYNNAMNKHRANELINEASKRATVVAAQAMMGRTGTISLGEFGNNSVSGATFGTSATIENNQITMTLSGIADPICTQMKVALGDNAIMAVDNKCTIIAFNADMSKGVAKPASCDPACTGGRKCVAENTCGCPDDKPFWNGTACEAKAVCGQNYISSGGYEGYDGYDDYYLPEVNECWPEVYCVDASMNIDEENKTCTCPGVIFKNRSDSYECCPNGNQVVTEISGFGFQECCPDNTQLVCVDWLDEHCIETRCCPDGKYTYNDRFICFTGCSSDEEEYFFSDYTPYEKYCCPEGKTIRCEEESDGKCKYRVCE